MRHMPFLIDECLPKKLKRELADYTVTTVQEKGWSGKKNGELLDLMRGEIDIFITADQNLRYQHNFQHIALSIIVLVAPDNRFITLQPLMPEVREVMDGIQRGEIVEVPRLAQTAPAEAPNITIDGDD